MTYFVSSLVDRWAVEFPCLQIVNRLSFGRSECFRVGSAFGRWSVLFLTSGLPQNKILRLHDLVELYLRGLYELV